MTLIRVDFAKRFYENGIIGVLINTVHDSIVLDINSQKSLDKICNLFYDVLIDFPKKFEKIFGEKFDLDIECEIEYGDNQFDLIKYKK